METPTGSSRRTRIATPRISERKKQLFRSHSSTLDQINDDDEVDDPLLGITPLKPSSRRQQAAIGNQTNGRNLFNNDTNGSVRSFRLRSSTSSSPETNKENKSAQKARGTFETTAGPEEQLPHLFTTTMRLNSNSNTNHPVAAIGSNIDNDSEPEQPRRALKRGHQESKLESVGDSPESRVVSPQSKQSRLHKECISTVAFYSNDSSRTSLRSRIASHMTSDRQRQRVGKVAKTTSPLSRSKLGINKGVSHKIRKPARHGGNTDLNDILNSLRNEKLRRIITTKREERDKVEKVHEILRKAQDPIKMAKPLSVMSGNDNNNNNSNNPSELCLSAIDFSDLSEDEEGVSAMELESVIPMIRHDSSPTTSPKTDKEDLSKRKFFKSGRQSANMEVRITDNIRASVSQGKIALVEAPVRKARQVRVKSSTIFSVEQATVDAILRNLDDTVVDEVIESSNTMPQAEPQESMEELPMPDPYDKYRRKVPYQTDDPAVMEQQELLLEFLISNNICTDENFEIFIADPDNHKDEATVIVDKLFMVVNAEQFTHDVNNECDNVDVQSDDLPQDAKVQNVELPVEPQRKLFPLFTQRLQPLPQKSSRRKLNVNARLITGAIGSNQYQIDAGQKAFGARQCQQCGLVYTVHEPEEEQLHRDYHNAVHVLRFKGWIDEDIVSVCPDWAADGRIIRINERAPAARLLRLTELLRVVDKELGYSSYIVPKTFVAYFAVRKHQIVGMCLVQPLTRAHRFIQIDGTDYFSEETFEATCGISRIWVAPLQRRQGIANKLLRAVQFHTILGSEISRDRIAFSTPTDDGRAIARHFTQNDNFLTYDQ